MIPGLKRLGREVALLAFFTVVAALATYPLVFHVLHVTPYHVQDRWIGDILVIQWNVWWMNEALVHLHTNPFTTHLLYHPHGAALFFTPFVPLFGLATVPLQQLVGGAAGAIWAVNLVTLLTFVLCGVFMVHLLRGLGVGWLPAVLAALPFAFAPFRFMHLARLHYLASFWLPLYALFLVRYLDRGGRRWLLGTALVGLGTLLSDHHHFLFLLFIAAAWFAYRLAVRVTAARTLVLRALRCGGLQVVVLAPLLPLVAPGLGGGENLELASRLHFEKRKAGRPAARDLLLAPDLNNLAYILVPRIYRLLAGLDAPPPPAGGGGTPAAGAPAPIAKETLPYRRLDEDTCPLPPPGPGWRSPAVLLSVLLGGVLLAGLFVSRRSDRWVWIALAAVAFLIALGPTRLVFGHPAPMPFRLFAILLPPLKISRYPAAFVLLGLFAIAPLLAFGFEALRPRRWVGRGTLILTVVLLAGAGWERILAGPLRFDATPPAAAYHVLEQDPVPGAVVELPLGNLFLHRLSMRGQILHHRPLAEGCVVRVSTAARRFLRSRGLMAMLQDPEAHPGHLDPARIARDLEPFFAAGFRYVLVHRAFFGEDHAGLDRVLRVLRAHRPAREARLDDIHVFRFERSARP